MQEAAFGRFRDVANQTQREAALRYSPHLAVILEGSAGEPVLKPVPSVLTTEMGMFAPLQVCMCHHRHRK